MPPSNISRTVMSGLRWVTVSRLLAQLLTWIITFLVIRLVSPTDYGLATLAGLFANYLSLLNELGFSVTLVQRQTRDQETLRHVFGAVLAVGILWTALLVLAAPLIGAITREPRVVPLVRVVAIQFLTMPFGVIPQARLSMDMQFRRLAVADAAAALIGGAVTLLMALAGRGAWSLVVGVVVTTAARTLLLNLLCPVLRAPRLQLSKLRNFAGFSGLVLLQNSLWYWYTQVDSFVVARALGASELGVYAVARQLTNIPLERAMGIINSVALPAFSMVKTDAEYVRRGYLKVLRVVAGYAFPVFWGLAVVSEPLVRLLAGPKWLASVPVIQLLCVSMPLRMLNAVTSSALTAVARQDVTIKSLLLAIVVMPACIVAGSHWGVLGVAAAWAVVFPFLYFFNVILVHRALQIPAAAMAAALWPAAVAAGTMALVTRSVSVVWLSALPGVLSLTTAVALGAAVFAATLWLVARPAAREMFEFARGVATHRA